MKYECYRLPFYAVVLFGRVWAPQTIRVIRNRRRRRVIDCRGYPGPLRWVWLTTIAAWPVNVGELADLQARRARICP